MIKRGFAYLFLALLLFPLVLATDTQITVKTLPLHKVFITISEPTQDFISIKIFSLDSGISGENTITFSNDQFDKFNVSVKVKRNDDVIYYTHFGTYQAGSPLYFILNDYNSTKAGYSIMGNSTNLTIFNSTTTSTPAQNTTNNQSPSAPIAANIPSAQNNSTTGMVISPVQTSDTIDSNPSPLTSPSDSKSSTVSSSKSFYIYIILGFLVIGAVIIFVLKGSSSSMPQFKQINLSSNSYQSSTEKKLEMAEEREQSDRKEVESLKQQRITELQSQISKEKKELRSLKTSKYSTSNLPPMDAPYKRQTGKYSMSIDPGITRRESKFKGKRI